MGAVRMAVARVDRALDRRMDQRWKRGGLFIHGRGRDVDGVCMWDYCGRGALAWLDLRLWFALAGMRRADASRCQRLRELGDGDVRGLVAEISLCGGGTQSCAGWGPARG